MRKLFLVTIVMALLVSCTSEDQIRKTANPDLYDGKYDSEFPYRNSSEQLEKISNTTRLVNSIAFYRTFNFDESDSMTLSSVRSGELSKYLATSTSFEETASGTGTLVYNRGNTIGLLTCAHIINFPDSIETYFMTESGNSSGFLKNFSVMVKQSIYIVPFYEDGNFEVVLKDKDLDVAVLKKDVKKQPLFRMQTMDFPLGRADELNWGSFVYVFGYPANYKMISKAIVSSPNYDKKTSFIIDAVANQGMSGGIVLAIRDGVPNFELVGMVKAAPAEYEYVLRPTKNEPIIIGSEYKGPIIATARKNIKYGITKVLAIESILEYLQDNVEILTENGMTLDGFFK